MDEITIRYWSPHGRQEERKFHRGHSKIDLVMRAANRVDLTNLQECSRLEILDLSNNMIETLDLTPLQNCSTLKEICLRGNHLVNLDLWPLVQCPDLEVLDLSENRLHRIDLSPVFLKTRVIMDSSVVIHADQLLRYIFTRKELTERFYLKRPDGAPWSATPVIIWLDFETSSEEANWEILRKRVTMLIKSLPKEKWFNCQRGFLQSLDMAELSGYDGNPIHLIETTESDMSYSEARSAIYDRTLDLLEDQLTNNGPTLFLDVERMKNTRASKLIPQIIELREKEIENTTLQIKGSRIFLRPLWLTHYGLTILKAMNMGLTTDSEGLNRIQSSLAELDLLVQTKKVKAVQPTSSGKGSLRLRHYVFKYIRGMYD